MDTTFLEQAHQVTKEVRHEEYKVYAICVIVESTAKLKNTKNAFALLEKALQATKEIRDDEYKTYAMCAIAESTAKLGDSKLALDYLKQVFADFWNMHFGLYEDLYDAFGKLAELVAKLGDSGLAIYYLNDLIDSAGYRSPDGVGSTLLLDTALCKISKHAANVAKITKDASLLKQLSLIGTEIPASCRAQIQREAAVSMAKLGYFLEARQIAENIEDVNNKDSAQRGIAASMAKQGHFRQARKIAHSNTNNVNKARILAAILKSLCGT